MGHYVHGKNNGNVLACLGALAKFQNTRTTSLRRKVKNPDEIKKITLLIAATLFYLFPQGQCTHSAWNSRQKKSNMEVGHV